MKRDKVALYYSNSMNIVSSINDFIFEFGVSIPNYDYDTKEINSKYAPNVKIAMSPQHFKSFAQIVNTQMKKYEEQFGEIHLSSKKEGDEE